MKLRFLPIALVAAVAPAAHAATDAELASCRALRDAPARLACYDALPLGGAPAAAQPAAAPAPAAVFGFEQRNQPASADQIESRVLGLFEGWGPNTRIKLENGQVWQVVDDSRAFIGRQDPTVRIARGVLGSYIFEVVGRNTTARVRRVE